MAKSARPTQHEIMRDLFARQSILRAREMREAGVDGKTIARAVEDGEIDRISRGLYQTADADIDANQALAEIAKRMPKGVIAMVSALAFHDLTDQMPRKVWVAIGSSDWSPASSYPPTRTVRFSDIYHQQGIEHHTISGVSVPVYSVPKTLADMFRNPKLVDRSVAIEGLRSALKQRKATPGELSDAAIKSGAWSAMKPYLEALTSNG